MTNGGTTSAYPANNYFPSLLSNLGFVSLSGGNYLLSSTSAYLNKGYDGRNIGADIAKVTAMTTGAVVAPKGLARAGTPRGAPIPPDRRPVWHSRP
jgi:hypothetical protein